MHLPKEQVPEELLRVPSQRKEMRAVVSLPRLRKRGSSRRLFGADREQRSQQETQDQRFSMINILLFKDAKAGKKGRKEGLRFIFGGGKTIKLK